MLFNAILAVSTLAASTQAFDIPYFTKRQAQCPQVWFDISKELSGMFLGADGQCTDAARASIRGVFHDCFPDGGCDGSLLLFDEEVGRANNVPMTATMQTLRAMATKYNVSGADLLMFAGCKFCALVIFPTKPLTDVTAHAVATCPGGPVTQTLIGRKDATGPCPDNQLPPANAPGDGVTQRFAAKGFSAKDVAALIGAHTVSRQFVTGPNVGAAQDSTPGKWDITYFVETIKNTAPFRFVSDINLANQNEVGPWMTRFSTDKAAWDSAFVDAMARLELLGNDKASMVDCTAALPQAQAKARRDDRFAKLFAWR